MCACPEACCTEPGGRPDAEGLLCVPSLKPAVQNGVSPGSTGKQTQVCKLKLDSKTRELKLLKKRETKRLLAFERRRFAGQKAPQAGGVIQSAEAPSW